MSALDIYRTSEGRAWAGAPGAVPEPVRGLAYGLGFSFVLWSAGLALII